MLEMTYGLAGYYVQNLFPCCANCEFGGYLACKTDNTRMCICEILGECDDSCYADIAVEPLGICKAYKPNSPEHFRGRGEQADD